MRELRHYFGSPLFTTFVVFEPDPAGNFQGKWVFRLDEGTSLGQKMVDLLLCPPYHVVFDTGAESAEAQLRQKAQAIQFETNIEQLSDEQLVTLFEELCEAFYQYYKFGAFVEPVQWRTEQVLTNYLKGLYANESAPEVDSASEERLSHSIRSVFTVTADTFSVEILSHLQRCARATDKFLNSEPGTFRVLEGMRHDAGFALKAADIVLASAQIRDSQNARSLLDTLKEHSLSYYWKRNNYYSTQFIRERDVLIEIFSVEDIDLTNLSASYEVSLERIRTSKDELLALKTDTLAMLPAYYRNVVGLANTVGGSMVDRRKRNVMVANSAFDRILTALAERTNSGVEDLHLLIPQELRHFVVAPQEYQQRLKDRRQQFLVYQSDFPLVDELLADIGGQSNEEISNWRVPIMDDPFLAEGVQVESTLESLDMRLNLFTDSDIASSKLHGVTSYYDPAQPQLVGTARIIRNPKTEMLRTGEVLVAPSTTPDYIDAMERCLAIVTDWGGQTSHAAITSRELKKPCIIGTNFGSQVIRNGDKIRLDFPRGLVEFVVQE
jgi:phosphohistidine swiveling domain-containing protein